MQLFAVIGIFLSFGNYTDFVIFYNSVLMKKRAHDLGCLERLRLIQSLDIIFEQTLCSPVLEVELLLRLKYIDCINFFVKNPNYHSQ